MISKEEKTIHILWVLSDAQWFRIQHDVTDKNEKLMKTKKIWANLGVDNLERTTKFYTELGFKFNGASNELTSFIMGENDFIINFFLKDVLKTGIKGEIVNLDLGNEVIFTLSADSKAEVNNWESEVKKAGGAIISNAEEFGQGYYGFVFADPDGHRFNVFYM